MTDNNPNGDDFVNAQYDENGGVQEVPEGGFVEGQYDDQQVMATSWVCEYCQVENGLDTTECSGCGYDYAAGDEVSDELNASMLSMLMHNTACCVLCYDLRNVC